MGKQKLLSKVSSAILALPYVQELLEIITNLTSDVMSKDKKIEELEAELKRLKKLPKRPKIEASKLDDEKPKKGNGKDEPAKRAGSEKKKKKKDLPIDETRKLKAEAVPKDWTLIGYKSYIVQDVIVRRNNIKYEREIWQSPDGKTRMMAELPPHLKGRTFGPLIRGYIIDLYNSSHVTQPLIWHHLKSIGVDISSGQVNFILNEDKANTMFEEELLSVVKQGIAQGGEIRTDDTSARHKGKNGYCNCISTDLFTYFNTTSSKSRINFLEILQLDDQGYKLTEESLSYYKEQKLASKYLTLLSSQDGLFLKNAEELTNFFSEKNIVAVHAKRIITEGLLLGHLIENGFNKEQLIHSDDAGQFKVFIHCLCWKHAERPLKKLVIRNEKHQEQWNEKMSEFWQLYKDLKTYKTVSDLAQKRRKQKLEDRFDELCKNVENFTGLNMVLDNLKKKKSELLLVLDYPIVSLQNNETEREIREFAKRRKISGSTRSDNGKKYRDIFTSLKKTCRKLGVNFWDYIIDRITGQNKIPPLADILVLHYQ